MALYNVNESTIDYRKLRMFAYALTIPLFDCIDRQALNMTLCKNKKIIIVLMVSMTNNQQMGFQKVNKSFKQFVRLGNQ